MKTEQVKLENITFYNRRKYLDAKAIAGDDMQLLLTEYERRAGLYTIDEVIKPKQTKKSVSKKVSKKKSA